MPFPTPATADEPKCLVHQPSSFQPLNHIGGDEIEYCSAARLRNLLSTLQQVNITVTGSSMHPFIRSGERITLRKIESPLTIDRGDIILFVNSTGRLLLHRVIGSPPGTEKTTLQTKGDNQPGPDDAISPDTVIGIATRIEKKSLLFGSHSFDLESWRWQTVKRMLAWNSRFNLYNRFRQRCSKFLIRFRTKQIPAIE
jgi:signal peptidase I